jgi:hypothetical protein
MSAANTGAAAVNSAVTASPSTVGLIATDGLMDGLIVTLAVALAIETVVAPVTRLVALICVMKQASSANNNKNGHVGVQLQWLANAGWIVTVLLWIDLDRIGLLIDCSKRFV